MQVDQPLVDLEFVAVPSLRTFTTRLNGQDSESVSGSVTDGNNYMHRLTGGDLKDLGGETDGAFDAQLLVLCTIDEVPADYAGP